jgi:hypothetical protein
VIHSPPEFVHPRGRTHRVAALLAALLALGALAAFRGRLGEDTAWGTALAIAIATVLFWRHEADRVLEIHPEGLVLRSGSSARHVFWESVQEIRYRAVRTQAGGAFGMGLHLLFRKLLKTSGPLDEREVSIRCVLRDGAGRSFVVTSAWRGAGEAVAKILERVNPRLVREALGQVRSGGSAEFGPLTVTGDTIARGARVLRFGEVDSCGLDAGRFYVRRVGAWRSAIQLPVSRIPNAFVLLELLRQLGIPGLGRSDLPSATIHG